MTDIFVYTDAGTDDCCVEATLSSFKALADGDTHIQTLTADQVIKTAWQKNCRALIIPGGRSNPHYEALGKIGNQKIIEYVEEGGTYVGFCGGAYYGCAVTEFGKGTDLEIIRPGVLKFHPGIAIGPVFNAEVFEYDSRASARIALVTWEDDKTYACYFNGGCYFSETTDPNITVLARYPEHHDAPAIVRCQVGKGQALLCGAHPEYSAEVMAPTTAHEVCLKQELITSELSRSLLFKKLHSFI